MKRALLPSLTLVLALGLAGCSGATAATPAGESAPAPAASAPESSAPATEPADTPAEQPTTAGAGATPDTVRTAYEESNRSVFTLDAAQVQAFTGIPVSGDHAAILAAFGDTASWSADSRTQPYAKLITDAFARESGSANNALRALNDNPTALLRVYVSHNSHATIAHIGIDNKN
ncbi:hypothetical protein ACFVAE_17855 [Microbacterium sp. NPDC057659]|uniref:hypothetical protein n=1 Tax=Microbacterium sp. NPDC057659 TaxID=3346198 RepID=UPI00366E0AEC